MSNHHGFTSREGQAGSAVIEGILSFLMFLFLLFTMLNVVNYCRAQAMISNAIDSAAKEMSQYAYFYKMSGLEKISNQFADNGKAGADNLNDVIGTIDSLYQSIGTSVDNTVENVTNVTNSVQSGTAEYSDVEHTINNLSSDVTQIQTNMNSVMNAFQRVGNDPLLYMRSLAAVAANGALDTAKSYIIAAPLARLFFMQHFGNSYEEADARLKELGVVDGLSGMNFNMSQAFASGNEKEIHIVVYYKLHLTQFFNMTQLDLSFCKEARTIAWLGGDDVVEIDAFSVYKPTEGDPGKTEPGDNESNESGDTTDEGVDDDEEEEDEPVTHKSTGYWDDEEYPEQGADYYNYRSDAFRQELYKQYNITEQQELVVNGVIYGRDDYGTAYGMTYATDIRGGEDAALWAYTESFSYIKAMEDAWQESGGEKGFEPGSTKEYKYIVYVPENIPDAELEAMRQKAISLSDERMAMQREETGIDIPVSVEYVKAGGDYNYDG